MLMSGIQQLKFQFFVVLRYHLFWNVQLYDWNTNLKILEV